MNQDIKNKEWCEAVIIHPPVVTDAISAWMFDRGAVSVVEEDLPDGSVVLRVGFGPGSDDSILEKALADFLPEIQSIFELDAVPEASWSRVGYGDWAEKWKEGLEPIEIGGRLVVKPTWLDYPERPGLIMIELDPGMAFGTGQHATTYMCLDYLNDLASPENTDLAVLDVGTGSGILAICALALGFKHVTAFDNDPEVLPVADENLAVNGMRGKIDFYRAVPGEVQGQYGIILANLTSNVLIETADDLHRLSLPGAALILSGILREQADEVSAAYRKLGFEESGRTNRDEWTALKMHLK